MFSTIGFSTLERLTRGHLTRGHLTRGLSTLGNKFIRGIALILLCCVGETCFAHEPDSQSLEVVCKTFQAAINGNQIELLPLLAKEFSWVDGDGHEYFSTNELQSHLQEQVASPTAVSLFHLDKPVVKNDSAFVSGTTVANGNENEGARLQASARWSLFLQKDESANWKIYRVHVSERRGDESAMQEAWLAMLFRYVLAAFVGGVISGATVMWALNKKVDRSRLVDE